MELFIIFVALQSADIWTTHRALSSGGRELNPLLARLFDEFGHVPVLVAFKAVVVFLVFQYLIGEPYILGGLCVLYTGIVGNNLYQLRKANRE